MKENALKGKQGELQIPTDPRLLLDFVVLHAQDETLPHSQKIEDIYHACAFWMVDRDMKGSLDHLLGDHEVEGLNS